MARPLALTATSFSWEPRVGSGWPIGEIAVAPDQLAPVEVPGFFPPATATLARAVISGMRRTIRSFIVMLPLDIRCVRRASSLNETSPGTTWSPQCSAKMPRPPSPSREAARATCPWLAPPGSRTGLHSDGRTDWTRRCLPGHARNPSPSRLRPGQRDGRGARRRTALGRSPQRHPTGASEHSGYATGPGRTRGDGLVFTRHLHQGRSIRDGYPRAPLPSRRASTAAPENICLAPTFPVAMSRPPLR